MTLKGHSRSPPMAVTSINAANFALVSHCSYRFRDITIYCAKIANLFIPSYINIRVRRDLSEFIFPEIYICPFKVLTNCEFTSLKSTDPDYLAADKMGLGLELRKSDMR